MCFMKLMHLLQVYMYAFRAQVMPRASYVRHHIIHCMDVECQDDHPLSFEEHLLTLIDDKVFLWYILNIKSSYFSLDLQHKTLYNTS